LENAGASPSRQDERAGAISRYDHTVGVELTVDSGRTDVYDVEWGCLCGGDANAHKAHSQYVFHSFSFGY
jgi:hypothetical protein